MTPTLPIDIPMETAPRRLPSQRLLHQLFEQQADVRPRSTAVVFGSVEATYDDLERSANRLARYLRRQRVERGSSVAMLLPRSLYAYRTLLGILKSGAA